jgi:ribosomal protein L37AE/L43A
VEDYPRTQTEFEARFATEVACRAYLTRLRWPEGFRCPVCRSAKAWAVRAVLWQCAACGRQTSVTAGTIFQDTRTPLTVWFRAMWCVTSTKTGTSALALKQVLGLGSYQTAWTWLHKLRRAMIRPGRDRLSGRVEVDETFVGGGSAQGRSTTTKALVVVAAEEVGRGIGRIRMRRIPDGKAKTLQAFIDDVIAPGSEVHTDGWDGYERVKTRYHHRVSFLRGHPAVATELLPRVHRVVSLLKTLVAWHPSRRRESRTSGLLPRRVHLSLQPPNVPTPRQIVFPTGPASRRHRTRPVSKIGATRRPSPTAPTQPVGVT